MAERQAPDKLLKSERRLTNVFATTTSLGAGLLGGVAYLGVQVGKFGRNLYNAVSVAQVRGNMESNPEAGVASTLNELLHQLPEKVRTPEVQQAFKDKIAAFSMDGDNISFADTPQADAIIGKALFKGHAPQAIQSPKNALLTVGVAAFATAAVTLGAVHLYRKHQERRQQAENPHVERLAEQTATLKNAPASLPGR